MLGDRKDQSITALIEDDDLWEKDLSYDQLAGIDRKRTDETNGVLVVEEGENTKPISYTLFNIMTLAAFRPMEFRSYAAKRYTNICNQVGFWDLSEDDIFEDEYSENIDWVTSTYMRKVAILASRLVGKEYTEDTAKRMVEQVHKKVVQENQSKFHLVIGPYESVYEQEKYYRAMPKEGAAPARLTKRSDAMEGNDALDGGW